MKHTLLKSIWRFLLAKKIWISLVVLFAAACAAPAPEAPPTQAQGELVSVPTDAPTSAPLVPPVKSQPDRDNLKDLGPAPELGNEVWLNVDQPLSLADLRGKVVLLEMWTFG
jgi:hypothetical protein